MAASRSFTDYVRKKYDNEFGALVHSENSSPVIAIYYHKNNCLSLTTILTHREDSS